MKPSHAIPATPLYQGTPSPRFYRALRPLSMDEELEREPLAGMEQAFFLVYFGELSSEVAKNPDEYAWAPEAAALVARRMTRALRDGSGSHDSNSIRRTCRALGIKSTRSAIRDYLRAAPAAKS